MKIYTKTGDDGTTALFSGGRVAKHHLRIETYGTVDELNSQLGLVRAFHPSAHTDEWLEHVQNQLFYLGADLATPLDAKSTHIVRLEQSAIDWLEDMIDHMTAELPELRQFILPGGSPAGAHLHVARTICRRAERFAVALAEVEDIGGVAVPYLNRLSDFLFTLSRFENKRAGESEQKWSVK